MKLGEKRKKMTEKGTHPQNKTKKQCNESIWVFINENNVTTTPMNFEKKILTRKKMDLFNSKYYRFHLQRCSRLLKLDQIYTHMEVSKAVLSEYLGWDFQSS